MGNNTYTVKKGDTLGGISNVTGVSLDSLIALNNIKNADAIREGQILTLSNLKPTQQQLPVNLSLLDALNNWDLKGDLARAEWRDWAILNLDLFLKYYAAYRTHLKNNNLDALYGAAYKPNRVISSEGTKTDIGKAFFKSLLGAGFNENQALAILANSYHETNGWNNMILVNGPAKGMLLMEKDERDNYNSYLSKNNLKDNYDNLANYIASLYLNTKSIPLTRYDRNKTGEYYTTDLAYSDWNSGDIGKATQAFMYSYERPGKPALDKRLAIANILAKYKTWFYKHGGKIHIKKSNEGKFTDYCGGNVTQECIDKGKNSNDSIIRKRATFADNARKWKHYNGGMINYIDLFKYE